MPILTVISRKKKAIEIDFDDNSIYMSGFVTYLKHKRNFDESKVADGQTESQDFVIDLRKMDENFILSTITFLCHLTTLTDEVEIVIALLQCSTDVPTIKSLLDYFMCSIDMSEIIDKYTLSCADGIGHGEYELFSFLLERGLSRESALVIVRDPIFSGFTKTMFIQFDNVFSETINICKSIETLVLGQINGLKKHMCNSLCGFSADKKCNSHSIHPDTLICYQCDGHELCPHNDDHHTYSLGCQCNRIQELAPGFLRKDESVRTFLGSASPDEIRQAFLFCQIYEIIHEYYGLMLSKIIENMIEIIVKDGFGAAHPNICFKQIDIFKKEILANTLPGHGVFRYYWEISTPEKRRDLVLRHFRANGLIYMLLNTLSIDFIIEKNFFAKPSNKEDDFFSKDFKFFTEMSYDEVTRTTMRPLWIKELDWPKISYENRYNLLISSYSELRRIFKDYCLYLNNKKNQVFPLNEIKGSNQKSGKIDKFNSNVPSSKFYERRCRRLTDEQSELLEKVCTDRVQKEGTLVTLFMYLKK